MRQRETLCIQLLQGGDYQGRIITKLFDELVERVVGCIDTAFSEAVKVH